MLLKFATAALLAIAALPPTLAQFSDVSASGFQAPPLVVGDLAVWCIFALLFIVQTILCFCSLIVGKGHRTAYAILFPFSKFSFIICCAMIAWIVVNNLSVDITDQVYPPLAAIVDLFGAWANSLLYLAINCIHWNRHAAINAATEGRAGTPIPQIVLAIFRAILLLFVFVSGTAAGALRTMYFQALYPNESDFSVQSNANVLARYHAQERANYVYNAFWSLTAVEVTVSSFLLYNVMRRVQVNDAMTKAMLFGVSPLYVLMIIVQIIFVIIFSPAGKSALSTRDAYNSANLADDIMSNVLSYAIAMILIIMGLKRSNWIVQGGNVHGEGSPDGAKQGWQQQQVYGQPQQAYYPQPQYAQQPYPPQQQYAPQQQYTTQQQDFPQQQYSPQQQDSPPLVLEKEQGQEQPREQSSG